MTVEEAKAKYGAKPDNEEGHDEGYVCCYDCPCDVCNGDHCPNNCSGYDDAYEAIAKYMTDREGTVSPTPCTAHHDPVSNPSHYTQGNIECIDAMVAAFGKEAVATFCLCNAFKYCWRTEHKNGMEDVDKAIWYLNKRKELIAIE